MKITGAPNGASRRSPFDRWFRYAAGFCGSTLTRCFEVFPDGGGLIIDPFAGVATTGTRAVAEGYSYRGIETHPLIAEFAALKFGSFDETMKQDLLRSSGEFAASIETADVSIDDETILVKRSFEEDTLKTLIALRRLVEAADHHLVPYLRCALVGVLRDVASVKVGWPYQRPGSFRKPPHRSVTKRFLDRVKWLTEDLPTLPADRDARIIAGDSRSINSWKDALGNTKASICLSSPPYLNNFDYADSTRLELYFLGKVRSWAELCSSVRVNMVAATTQQSTRSRARSGRELLVERFPKTANIVCDLVDKLSEKRRERSRGKEYDQLIPAYFADISEVLMRSRENLEDEALLAWVVGDSAPYGVYIDTPAVIAGLAAEIGFIPLEDINLRVRGKRWALNGTRHQVALTERLIVLRRGS